MSAAKRQTAKRQSVPGRERLRLLLFLTAFVLGAAFMLNGIFRGEVAVVLKKAVYICLECIGIG